MELECTMNGCMDAARLSVVVVVAVVLPVIGREEKLLTVPGVVDCALLNRCRKAEEPIP